MANTFTQVLRFQVKPDRLEDFEALMKGIRAEQEKLPGLICAKYMKRFYTFDGIPSGEKPRELTKIVKCVKYYA